VGCLIRQRKRPRSVKGQPEGISAPLPRVEEKAPEIASGSGTLSRAPWEELKFLLPSESEIQRQRREAKLLTLDSVLSSMGADPIAILTKAYGQRSRKRPRGRPRKAVPSSDEIYRLLDELIRDLWDLWGLAAKLGTTPRFERLDPAGRLAVRRFFVRSALHQLRQKEWPTGRSEVRAMNRWLALEGERAARKERRVEAPSRGELIEVPNDGFVSVVAIEKDVERNAPWLRDN
jgi:hypothetical protein